MNYKRIFASLTASLLLAGAAPVCVQAAEPYTYTLLEDGTAEIAWTDTAASHAEIPAQVDGCTVTVLAEDAFKGCGALESVTLPDTLTTIQDSAFSGCAALTEVEIPESVVRIGSFVFEGCTSLTAIEVAEGCESYCDDGGVLYTKDMGELIRYPQAKEDVSYTTPDSCAVLSPWSFTECANLQRIELPGVVSIGADAFFCATSVQTVQLSDDVQELIGATFAYCTNLRKINLPASLKTIGDKCFYGCVSLPSVTLPNGLTTIGEQAFYGCVQLKEVEVPDSVRSIGKMALGYSVNPDTNENAVVNGFTMKAVANSQAHKYAEKNQISCDVETNRTVSILILLTIIVVVAAVVIGIFAYFRKAEKEKAELAAKKEEKSRRRRERRSREEQQ